MTSWLWTCFQSAILILIPPPQGFNETAEQKRGRLKENLQQNLTLPLGGVNHRSRESLDGIDVEQCEVAYFVPQDIAPVADYDAKIANIVYAIEQFFSSDLRQKGMVDCGIKFRRDQQFRPVVKLVIGKRDRSDYNPASRFQDAGHWASVVNEVESSYNTPPRMLLIFSETYGEELTRKPFWPGHLALGRNVAGNQGTCVFSSWILRDELMPPDWSGFLAAFEDNSPFVGRKAVGYPGINAPRFELLEDGVGGCLHEVGHMLGLYHHVDSYPGQNVMFHGFRRLRKCIKDDAFMSNEHVRFSDQNASILVTSPFVNPRVKFNLTARPQLHFTMTGQEALTLSAHDSAGIQLVFTLKATNAYGWAFDQILADNGSLISKPSDMTLSMNLSNQDDLLVIAVNSAGRRGFVKLESAPQRR